MRISKEYREANKRLHETNPKYGGASAKWAPKVRELVQSTQSATVLDYGCGKGNLAQALPELDVREYDPAFPGKDSEPEAADLVVCTDVLEHIEPDCLDEVLRHLRSLTTRYAFLNIATRPATKTLPDGRNTHLIIRREAWWRRRIEALFHVAEWTPDGDWAVSALVQPRQQGELAEPRRSARTSSNDQPQGWFKIPGVQEGKWGLDRQMSGLELIRRACRGASVLDLGCAEGAISLELAKEGASLVHGVELEGRRVEAAEQLFKQRCPQVRRRFIEWDLERFDELYLDITADHRPRQPFLRSRYDIVLCLAIAQKLSNPGRFLRLASTLSSALLAVRLPYPVIDDPRSFNIPVDVKRMLAGEFELIQETEGYPRDLTRPYQQGDDAWLGIFRRKAKPRAGFELLGWLTRQFPLFNQKRCNMEIRSKTSKRLEH